ncbi:hypothetical protein HH219_13125 [Pseudoalteromonas sp. NEC-BIFX-2020_015]|uniref:ORC-CDC6 family AAA ATPase n=1 Tax=Pseudoalteromonas sp. NEC-BIFX-2020_015 TaxID=2729544 RepID=UPI001461577E|nr:hypothetical protein [Pseudoalteromonas sp. NEC-BIFX-2020_015]NMR26463.1 hypothetical protein [Pseudoalteromonas sp. NEC-BIFX-2020_015]
MDLLQRNPFTTIKANDLDDTEINEQWVDIQGTGFVDFFCPTHKISQYLIGGKGSGKTHLMRYFSYKPQILRHEESLLEGIENDGYFGVYFQASGLNGARFENLPYKNELKEAMFAYSFDLWCAGLVIESIITLQGLHPDVLDKEQEFCSDVLSLFSALPANYQEISTLKSLKGLIVKLSNEVDLVVNNAFFIEKPDLNILASRGSLIFGIPKLLNTHSTTFKDITFLYLIDELENISEEQQKYFNTLIREKKLPCSFRFGARKHGIKTYKTLGSGEENREGHEFETTKLDNVFNEIKHFEDFAINLIMKRLIKAEFITKDQRYLRTFENNSDNKKEYLISLFEKPDINAIVQNVKLKNNGLSSALNSFNGRINAKIDAESALSICKNLSFPADSTVELAAIHLFSQYWSSNSVDIDLLKLKSEEIAKEIKIYASSDGEASKTSIANKFKYYKNNYTASAIRSISQSNFDEYLGLEQLLQLTKGFPRHILTVLRNIYKIEVFHGNSPFTSSKQISLKSQRLALKESSEWFHNDCTSEGSLGSNVSEALSKLCEILRIEMYSDKPVECSASGFTVDTDRISKEAKDILDWAELIRVIIEVAPRQDKNSQKLIPKYHLNGLLCPKWGLSLSKRGAISFTPENFNKIFDPQHQAEFQSYRSEFHDARHSPYDIHLSELVAKPKPKPKPKSPGNDDQMEIGF